jgi:predicted RNase H-like HicB family nuclease
MIKGKHTFTAQIEKDAETNLYIGYIPGLPGAHTQAETLDELQKNLIEVAQLCLEELTENELSRIQSQFIGTQQVSISL